MAWLGIVPVILLSLLLGGTVAGGDAATSACQLLPEASPLPPPSPGRHLLLVHVSPGAPGLKQLAAHAAAAGYAIKAGLSLDCVYREVAADPLLMPLLPKLPMAHLRPAGAADSWPLLLAEADVTGDSLLARLKQEAAVVPDLDDASFEGVTQAATGSTTGHWLVAFLDPYDPDLAAKTRLLTGLAQLLRSGGVSVARVLLSDAARVTAERFAVAAAGSPGSILLRSGGYYRVPHHLPSWPLIVAFATHGYSGHRRVVVPQAPSPFDRVVDAVLAFLLSFNSGGVSPVYIALCGAGAFAVMACVCVCTRKGTTAKAN